MSTNGETDSKQPSSSFVVGSNAMNRQSQCRRVLIGLACGATFALAATAAPAQEKQISVWWVKGFYKSEDDALFDAIKKFEAKTGIKEDLSQYAVQEMIPK